MLMSEVCKKCALTKKAVEYYIGQELIAPAVQENGYRDFARTDVERLKKISVLRGLGLPVGRIRQILSGQSEALDEAADQELLEIGLLQEKQRLIRELARTQDWEGVQCRLLQLQKKQSVLERLRNAFPGYYGSYVIRHFAPYLDEPVRTEQQQEAFETVVAFLDNVRLEIPDDLREFYQEVTAGFGDADCERMVSGMPAAISDIEGFIGRNREAVEGYMALTQTEEYRKTPMYRMVEVLGQFGRESGYNDIFIPAMCRLSKSYQEYHTALQKANEKFLQMYPEWGRTRT